jgi:hypothetical protein
MADLHETFNERRRCLREEDNTSLSLLATIRILLDEVEMLRADVDELIRQQRINGRWWRGS